MSTGSLCAEKSENILSQEMIFISFWISIGGVEIEPSNLEGDSDVGDILMLVT